MRKILVAVVVAALVSTTGASTAATQRWYVNQTPYGDPASTRILAPPSGYTLRQLQLVARHGARSLTSPGAEDRTLALWQAARNSGRLTTLGRSLGPDLLAFLKAERALGYGNLSGVGETEWKGIGRRTADNYRPFFERVETDGDRVVVPTTSVLRTKHSSLALRYSLRQAFSDLSMTNTVDDRMVITSGSTSAGKAAIARALKRPATVAAAKHLLGRLYSASFVRTIDDPVAAAMDLYLLYCTAPGLADETDVTFAAFVPLDDAKVLGQAKDTQNFYRFGPGVAGERASFAKVDPVLRTMLTSIDLRLAGGSTAAVLRVAHGETTMPFAARVRIAGSATAAPRSKDFSWGSNPWRGQVAGGLAGSVEWALYTAPGKAPLVTMRQNEQPVAMGAPCRAVTGAPKFYTVAELKRCLA